MYRYFLNIKYDYQIAQKRELQRLKFLLQNESDTYSQIA